jgi:hypothetical protein
MKSNASSVSPIFYIGFFARVKLWETSLDGCMVIWLTDYRGYLTFYPKLSTSDDGLIVFCLLMLSYWLYLIDIAMMDWILSTILLTIATNGSITSMVESVVHI